MRLRCEVAVPAGFRQGRVFVRLERPEPDLLVLLPARRFDDATHQLVSACGRPLLTHLAERDQAISGELVRAGFWEFAESAALLWLARPGIALADAGANLGYYEALLGPALGPGGRIYAFEPEPRNHLLLTANALLARQLHPEACPVEVFSQALCDRVGEAWLHVFERNLGLHSLAYGANEAADTRLVPTTTLDALRWPEGSPPTLERRIGLLKADVQGSEFSLLRGAERTLARDRPVLCLEFEPHLSGPEACAALVDWLRQRSYSSFRVFHSNVSDPHQTLAESMQALSAEEVLMRVQRKLIGPYGTLTAFPDPGKELWDGSRQEL